MRGGAAPPPPAAGGPTFESRKFAQFPVAADGEARGTVTSFLLEHLRTSAVLDLVQLSRRRRRRRAGWTLAATLDAHRKKKAQLSFRLADRK